METKPWQTPRLVILVQSQPEEAVLAGCKASRTGPTTAAPSVTPQNSNYGCYLIQGCVACSALSPS
jgi:hypothetical protein